MDDQIQIIKHRDDVIPCMLSDKDWLLGFGAGFGINADKNKQSEAFANDSWNVYGRNIRNLKYDRKIGHLYFAGGND